MAGLASDIELRKRGTEDVRGRVVTLLEIGRVAIRAGKVPILRRARPMQLVRGDQALTGIQAEVTLPPLGLGSSIPSHRQRLQPSPARIDQVLLQRLKTKRVRDAPLARLTVGPWGRDEVSLSVAAEGGGDPIVSKCFTGKRRLDAVRTGDLNGAVVIGAAMSLGLALVTARAHLRSHVRRRRRAS